jgi:hypothetical protein
MDRRDGGREEGNKEGRIERRKDRENEGHKEGQTEAPLKNHKTEISYIYNHLPFYFFHPCQCLSLSL